MEESSELEPLLRWAAMVGISDSRSTPAPPSQTSCLGHSLAVASFPDAGGRGLAAVRDLKKGELVLRVPRSTLLMRESVLEADEKLSDCIKRHPRLSSTQVLLSYGTYTNLELLEHYGFLLDVNPNDKAFIELDADIYRISSWPRDSLHIQPDGSPSFALLCALRLWATPANHRKAVKHKSYTGSLLSVENELFIMKWLAKKCQQLLGMMPTVIDKDNLLLQAIDTMLDQHSGVEGVEICSCRELESFLQVNCMVNQAPESQLTAKAKRSLERFKLAIRWRLSHKTMLLRCISHCKRISDRLSSQH